MSLFRIVANIGINSSELEAGLKRVQSTATSAMNAIGDRVKQAFTAAAIEEFIKKVARAAGEMGDLADQLNITTAEVQALQKAADHSGAPLETYFRLLSKIRKLKADFASGEEGAVKAFGRAGLNPNASDLSIMQALGTLPDEKAFAILDTKSAKVKQSLVDLQKLTPIEMVDDESIKKLDTAGDKLGDIMRVIQALTARGIGGLLSGRSIGQTAAGIFGDIHRKRIVESLSKGESAEMYGPEEFGSIFDSKDKLVPGAAIHNAIPADKKVSLGKFARIDMGDRANVGGFFGPNADLNRSMQRTLASMDQSLKTIEKSVSTTMNTQ